MTTRGFVLAVCGLRTEQRLLRATTLRTVAGGGRSAMLAAAIEREVAAGAGALVSFGIAGALAPEFRAGDLLVANGVATPDGDYATDVRWTQALRQGLPAAHAGTVAGRDVIVADPASKAALRQASGADAVDMESHIAARIAHAHGLPFVVLRAVADTATRALPPAALVAMRDEGGIDLVAVLRSIAMRPGQLAGLLGVARDTRAALRSLDRGRRLLGDRLGGGLRDADLDQLPVDVV